MYNLHTQFILGHNQYYLYFCQDRTKKSLEFHFKGLINTTDSIKPEQKIIGISFQGTN